MKFKIKAKKILLENTLGINILSVYRRMKSIRLYFKGISIRRKVNTKKLKKLKNTKVGKRCFIVGNGPSLTIADLEKIQNEDSFAVNRIYKIFGETQWRPTFYTSQDTRILDEVKKDMDIMLQECEGVFLNSYVTNDGNEVENKDNLYYFFINSEKFFPKLARFSNNVSRWIYDGLTVAYANIQLAVYMGYSEIYLIGTDNNYSIVLKSDGTVEQKEQTVNYMKGLEGEVLFYPQIDNAILAYRKARQVCEKKGIIIKNATRGGKLEEFERVNFDDLF